MKEKTIRFFKQETVLCAAVALAAGSMLFVHPDMEYLGYIDFRTLAILFCLMGVMAGLQKSGAFQYVAQTLLSRVSKAWQLVLILVQLCFFSSMLVTNDVALITFVPFTFIVLGMIGQEAKQQLVVPVVVLQTIAANLGSMLTPIGNPQNLYLYGKAGLSVGDFVLLMLPYASVSLLVILIWGLCQSMAYHGPIQVSFAEGAGLSGFTEDLPALMIGVNLGGLGTLIASMASLISYKLIAREENQAKGIYFRYFTAANICFLIVLLMFELFVRR